MISLQQRVLTLESSGVTKGETVWVSIVLGSFCVA